MQVAFSVLIMPHKYSVCPCSSQRDVFFSLLIIVATPCFKDSCKSCRFVSRGGDMEENKPLFHILISRKKRMQILQLDHNPSLSYVLFLCLDREN